VSAVYVRPYKVGFLGFGVQGARLADRLVRSHLFQVTATFDPSNCEMTNVFPCKSAVELAARRDVEVLVVASPPQAHEEGLSLACKHGKPVLLEVWRKKRKETKLVVFIVTKTEAACTLSRKRGAHACPESRHKCCREFLVWFFGGWKQDFEPSARVGRDCATALGCTVRDVAESMAEWRRKLVV
jgi:hypothetical protein